MDKVQIYTLIMTAFELIVVFTAGVCLPDEKYTKHTNLQRLGWLPVNIAFQLPIIGRVFGWW